MIKKTFRSIAPLVFAMLAWSVNAQTYRPIAGFSAETNRKLESFLNSTRTMKERKVAVFDCDGTLLGQTPYYLADEATYDFARKNYEGKKDENSKTKWAVCRQLIDGDNVTFSYIENYIRFYAGMTPDEMCRVGWECFHDKFQRKFYPEMKELLGNLEEYGIEIWVITASPELLYQRFIHEELGIPVDRIIGVKSCIRDGIVTDETVRPIPPGRR